MGASGDPLITCSRVVDAGLDDVTAAGDRNVRPNVEYFEVWTVGDRKAMQALHDERTTAAVANVRGDIIVPVSDSDLESIVS